MKKSFNRLWLLAAALAVVLLASGDQGAVRAHPEAPSTFMKMGMPDFGQHSERWCWVAAAANSFWWFEHGLDGVAGTGDDPVPGMVPASFRLLPDPASISAGNYFDNNDLVGNVVGYRRLLKEIAQATFKDINMDGIQQPATEAAYKYSEGVNLWDYLVGLRDYVEARNVPLIVSTITDPGAVAPGGCLVFGREPTPGQTVPRVPTTFEAPTLMEYARQVSLSQDVILVIGWTAGGGHVVTGVGYDLTSNPPTITISDPGTHVAPPHDDPGGDPDHNNAPGHDPRPYDVCMVTSPAPRLQVDCPSGVGQVASLVIVAPSGDDGVGTIVGVLTTVAVVVMAGGVTAARYAWRLIGR